MGKAKVLTTQEIRKMQLLQLDMLAELDRVCRNNHICYSIMSGTLLGAVRHKGYIPWDDDADIAMLRQDYEKFKQAANELDAQICYFQDHDTDPAYRWGYGKLRRTGTVYIRAGQEHIECRTGVFIDIFPLDDVPGHLPGQMLQDFICFCMRKILWSEVGKLNGNILHKTIYRVLSYIPVEFIFWITKHMSAKSRNDSDKRVRTLLFPSIGKLYVKNKLKERYGMPKKWFQELKEYTFEGKKLWGTKDYDAILTYTYGDYMTLPPEEERNQQALVSDYHF